MTISWKSDKYSKIFALLIMLTATFTSFAGIRMSVEYPRGQRSINVGDKFYITIVAENVDGEMRKPASIPGCTVGYFANFSESSFTSINGKTTQQYRVTYTLTLIAEKEGKFSFGPVSFGGQKSNTVSYTIGAAGSKQPQSSPDAADREADGDAPKFIGTGNGNLFLRASVSKTSAYEKEALVYTVKLYTSYDNLKFLGAAEAPKFEGFVIEKSDETSRSFSVETVNGRTYKTAIIARYIIFPQMTGVRNVIGNTYRVSVDEREYYHDSYFGQISVGRPLEFNVKPNDLKITVNPLPTPRPADFCGGVGNFSISSSLPAHDFKTNQPASIVYTVTGSGNLKYVNLPDLAGIYPKELEVYSPTTEIKDNVGATNVSGSIKFDYSFTPMETGDFKIPEVKLVYFNPETGKYETAVAKGYDIHVTKGAASAKSQSKEKLTFYSDLMKVSGLSKNGIRPVIYSFYYWLIYLLLIVALWVIVLIYKRYVKLNSDLDAKRSRQANSLARKRLKKATQAMKAGNREQFYDAMLEAMYGYIGDKLKMKGSDLNRDNFRQVLEEHDVEAADIDAFIHLFDELEQDKYSPVQAKMPMQELLDHASELIMRFEATIKRQATNSKSSEGSMNTSMLETPTSKDIKNMNR